MASIEKRGENSYRLTACCGTDGSGKKIRKRKIVELDPRLTERQIEAALQKEAALFDREVESGQFLDGGKVTFAEFTGKWIADYASTELAPKTFNRYQDLLKRIIPVIGHITLQKLQPNHLMDFYANLKESGIRIDSTYISKPELKEIMQGQDITDKILAEKTSIDLRTIRKVLNCKSIKHTTAQAICKILDVKRDKVFDINGEPAPLSDQTIKHHHRLISAILTFAVQWQLIMNNPAERVRSPKVDAKEPAHFDEDTCEMMLELLDREPLKYKTMIYVTLYTGCRLGELAGLEWSDVNSEKNLLRIRQASQYISGQGTFTKSPKNESSSRIISMPDVVMELLKEYRTWWIEQKLKCKDLWYKDSENKDGDRLFVQWNGAPIHPSTPTKWFKTFRERHNLPELKFHGLRHTNASLLISEGVDVQTIAKRLGHSKATTTTSIYSHFLRKPDREAAEKLENMFHNKKKDKKETSKQA